MLLIVIAGAAALVLFVLMIFGACRTGGRADDAIREMSARERGADVIEFDWPERRR